MAITLDFADVLADLGARLAPHGYSLAEQPGQPGRALLTHPDIEEVIRTRKFLNHGLGATPDSGVVLSMSPRKPELVLESGFRTLLTCPASEPGTLVRALLKAGQEVLESNRRFIQDSNPLHRKLLEHRDAITQAGFHLEPTFFVANLEAYRELKRVTRERTDVIGVALDAQGELVTTRLSCAFANPVPLAAALKVMGLGLAKG